MSTLVNILLLCLTFCCFSSSSSSSSHPRRVLHQPLFPRISLPPTQPPALSPQPQKQHHLPKFPFSSSSSSSPPPLQKPFFPSYHSPPLPPSPTVVATFPANISSLLLPHPYSHHHRSAAALAVSLSLFSLALLAAAAFVLLHRRRAHRSSSSDAAHDDDDDKTSRSDSLRLFPPNAAASDGADRKPHGKSSPTSELLYLGTVANSVNSTLETSSSHHHDGFRPPYQKLGDSPELNPLPPLPRHKFMPWMNEDDGDKNVKEKVEQEEEVGEEEEDDEEQFFSPRGSSGGNKEHRPPSPSAVAASSSRVFHVDNKFGSTSFTSRTPSYPRSNSLTFSRSPSLNFSPASVKSLPPNNPASPSFSSSSSSPREEWRVPARDTNSPARNLPPPPPPPPPRRLWEAPVSVRKESESEESVKPKLKALHWDKVKASSDRVMVWDQLRPSSFQ